MDNLKPGVAPISFPDVTGLISRLADSRQEDFSIISKLHLMELFTAVLGGHFTVAPGPSDDGDEEPVSLEDCRIDAMEVRRISMADILSQGIALYGDYYRRADDAGRMELKARFIEASGAACDPETLKPWSAREGGEELALVLSGGALLGSFQLGAIEYLVDGFAASGSGANWSRFSPDAIAGTSVGAINGLALSCFKEQTGKRLTAIWESIKRQDHFVLLDPEIQAIQKGANAVPLLRRSPLDMLSMLNPFPKLRDKAKGKSPLLTIVASYILAHGSLISSRTWRLVKRLGVHNDGIDLLGALTHQPIQKMLYDAIEDEYGAEHPSIPFICPVTNLNDSHEYLFSSEGIVYKYSNHDDFTRIIARYRPVYHEMSRKFADSFQRPENAELVEKDEVGHPADDEESGAENTAYDPAYLRLWSDAARDGDQIPVKYRVMPGVIGSSNIPLALGTVNAILRPLDGGSSADSREISAPPIRKHIKIHGVDGALRLNFPINALLNHFEDNHDKHIPPSPARDFRKLITISATTKNKEYKDFRGDGEEGVQIFENLGRSIDIVLNQINVASRTSLKRVHGGRRLETAHIDPVIQIHSGYVVDPGLIQISRDYGRMRAFDIMDLHGGLSEGGIADADLVPAMIILMLLTLEIAVQRKRAWELEQDIVLTLLDRDPGFWNSALRSRAVNVRRGKDGAGLLQKVSRRWEACQGFVDCRKRKYPHNELKRELYGPCSIGTNRGKLQTARNAVARLSDIQTEITGIAGMCRGPADGGCEMHVSPVSDLIELLNAAGCRL